MSDPTQKEKYMERIFSAMLPIVEQAEKEIGVSAAKEVMTSTLLVLAAQFVGVMCANNSNGLDANELIIKQLAAQFKKQCFQVYSENLEEIES